MLIVTEAVSVVPLPIVESVMRPILPNAMIALTGILRVMEHVVSHVMMLIVFNVLILLFVRLVLLGTVLLVELVRFATDHRTVLIVLRLIHVPNVWMGTSIMQELAKHVHLLALHVRMHPHVLEKDSFKLDRNWQLAIPDVKHVPP